ncbi:MAG: hypothetical protein HW377_379 [Actinobacteria bacterium]|nr:hypothetical protein [Actinomycetota bacterium]
MMRLRFSSFAALLAVLGGLALIASVTWRNAGTPSGNGGITDGESRFEPEIVLQGVDLVEIRKGEAPNRLLSEHATYHVFAGDLSASGVTIRLPGRQGDVVLRTPEAHWDLRAGRIALPVGGTAENGGGWSATVVSAKINLRERILTAHGEARLAGPGLTIEGDNLVWRWRDGKMELERPKTRVLPARALGRKG